MKVIDCPTGISETIRVRIQPRCGLTGMFDDCTVEISYRSEGKCLEMYSVIEEVMSIARQLDLNEEIAKRIAEVVRVVIDGARIRMVCRYINAELVVDA